MKVTELIEELKKYPSDNLVLVEGYEGGFADIASIQQRSIILNHHKEDFYGPHELDSNGNNKGVVLFRASNSNVE